MTSIQILYIMSCTHVQPGTVGMSGMHCYNCNQFRKITDVHVYEWRMKCENCTYAPWCGLSQVIAKYHATQHVKKRDHHKTHVLYIVNPYSQKVRERMLEGTNATTTPGSKTQS